MDHISNHPLYRRHSIDTAMNSLWEFYKNNFLVLFITSMVMALAIQYGSTLINLRDLQSTTDPLLLLEKLKEFLVPMLMLSLVSLLFSTILQYYIIYKPLDPEINIFVSILKSMRYYIPYLIIMVLMTFFGSIAIVLGLFAIVVGAFFAAIYVMTLFLFVLPVMMVEGTDILKTITRTFTLAHKNFWSNIGWVSVFLILLIVISVIFSAIIMIPFSGSFLKTLTNPEAAAEVVNYTTNPFFVILSAIGSALTMPLMPILACILYFHGKATEDIQDQIRYETQPDNDRVKVEDLYAKPYSDDHPENPEKKD
jgi:hypothetical protein